MQEALKSPHYKKIWEKVIIKKIFMQQIYHKKNELFEVEFYQDKECTIPFDFKNAKNLYIGLKDGDCTPLSMLLNTTYHNAHLAVVHTPYIPCFDKIIFEANKNGYIITLNDITPNLSKYIPEDNAVLFLSQDNNNEYYKYFLNCKQCVWTKSSPIIYYDENKLIQEEWIVNRFHNDKDITTKPITIFLPYGTQSELQKANEVEKELKEKYGVKEVNLFVLHCFVPFENLSFIGIKLSIAKEYDIENFYFNKIITTNSTGILEPQNTERLQVIDCNEIFEEYLKTKR